MELTAVADLLEQQEQLVLQEEQGERAEMVLLAVLVELL